MFWTFYTPITQPIRLSTPSLCPLQISRSPELHAQFPSGELFDLDFVSQTRLNSLVLFFDSQ
jgi:hypothetical protein